MKTTTLMEQFTRQLQQLARNGISESSKEIAKEYLKIPFPDFLQRQNVIHKAIKQNRKGEIHYIDDQQGIFPILFVAPELDLERLIENKKRGILKFKKLLMEERVRSAYVIFDIKRMPRNKCIVFLLTTFGDRRTLKEKETLFLNYYYETKFKIGELSCSKF